MVPKIVLPEGDDDEELLADPSLWEQIKEEFGMEEENSDFEDSDDEGEEASSLRKRKAAPKKAKEAEEIELDEDFEFVDED